MKKIIAILLVSVFAITALTACGNKESDTSVETQAGPTAMDAGDLVSLIFKDLGLEMSQASDILVDLIGEDGSRTVTFKLAGQECTYVVNAYDGSIISKNIPEGAIEAVRNPEGSADAAEDTAAVDAVFNYIDGYDGTAEGITTSRDGSTVIVEFDYYGEHYVFYYDLDEGYVWE